MRVYKTILERFRFRIRLFNESYAIAENVLNIISFGYSIRVCVGMTGKLALYFAVFFVIRAENAEKKWSWGGEDREKGRSDVLSEEASGRYAVIENDDYYPSGGSSFGQYNPNHNPGISRPPNVPINGIYDANNQLYGAGHSQYRPGAFSGPSPFGQPGGPFKEFDRCKCTERFNCNSPGISYGHCDVGKRYCCYSTSERGQAGGPLPSRPVHSIENGVLVGPGGPAGGGHFQRPSGDFGGPVRPGGYRPNRPPGGGGFGLGGQNVYGPENGILVGPGANRPNFGIYARTAADKND
ncbi:unnamed protein product [Phyllotreta striolata]|uniref:Uncharacterized protein n=1 Tax=Phyllotreta striolata TaxID=444603 RepID=A0A9N9XPE9_PHYSR|nr:unnamed protein product [Phyllotreta striolata]